MSKSNYAAPLVLDRKLIFSRGEGPWLYYARTFGALRIPMLSGLPPRPRKPQPPLLNKEGNFVLCRILFRGASCFVSPWFRIP